MDEGQIVPTVTHGARVFRLPFAGLFRELTADERGRLRASVEAHGVRYGVMVYDSPTHGLDSVIDGANRLTLSAELDADIPVTKVRGISDEDAARLAETLNADRRHLSPDDFRRLSADRAARLKRVTTARAEGDSLPVIAAKEKVSLGQVQRDIQKAEQLRFIGVDKPGSDEEAIKPETVVGKDKVPQAAKKKPGSAKPGRKPKEKPPAPGQPIVITEADEQQEKARRAAPVDGTGQPIPPALRDTFLDTELAETVADLGAALTALDARYQRVIRSLSRKPYKFCDFSKITDKLNQIVNPKSGLLPQVIDHLKAGEPFAVCTCRGETPGHTVCRTGGYLPAWRYQELKGTEA